MRTAHPGRVVPYPCRERLPTDHGRTVFVQAATVHSHVVERDFVAPLARDDYTRLTGALSDIDEALHDAAD
ncbi:hypothetical protein QFZ66_007253 [Streptomyces sp. B4I13]|nr:hypothetical protein [Streptomyces sp. B4I13]